MDKLDHLGWVGRHHYYEIGGRRLGIRTTSEGFGERLDAILAEYRTEPSDGTPYYGVVLADGAEGTRREKKFHIFYRGTQPLVRTLDPSTLVRAMLSEFEFYLFAERDDAIYTDAGLVRAHGMLAVVPASVTASLWKLGGRVTREGLSLHAEPYIAVDAESGQVVPLRSALRIPDGSLETLTAFATTNGDTDPSPLDGPSRVDLLCSYATGEPSEERVEPISRGRALSQLTSNVVNLETLGITAVAGLARLTEGARCRQIAPAQPRPLLDTIVAAFKAL
ncbi:MAG TPA: hypothetical protein VMR89_07380 [Actinomycetota bacterium]|nr:hypothetical protein [Actinomycetota bacterium]